MTITRRSALIAAAATTLGGTARAQTAAELPVGIFNALTGNYAFGGVPIQNGIKLALEEAEKAGMPGGAKFKIYEGDTAGEKGQSINLVNQFVKRNNVLMLLGPTTSPEALAGGPVANDLQVPILAIGSALPILQTGPWAFKVQSAPTELLGFLGKFAVEKLGTKQMVLIFDQSNEGYVAQKNAVRDYCKGRGVGILGEEQILGSDTNFLALASKLSSMPVDTVFVGAPAEVAANLIQQCRQAGVNPKVNFIGPSTLGGLGFIKAGGKAVEGVHLVSDYSPASTSPVNVAFTNAYKARFNAPPDNWAALGYSLGVAAATAIRNSGPNPTRAKIRDEMLKLRRVPVPIGSGQWTLDEQRNPTYGGVILVVKNGNFTQVQW